jgi:hypothetical protein
MKPTPTPERTSVFENQETVPPPESAFYDALARVEHPEAKGHNLVELRMIPDVRVEGNRVCVRLALPFPNVRVKDQLIRLIDPPLGTSRHGRT